MPKKYKERNGGGKPEISFVALRNSKFEGLAIYRYSKYLNDEAIVDIFSVYVLTDVKSLQPTQVPCIRVPCIVCCTPFYL